MVDEMLKPTEALTRYFVFKDKQQTVPSDHTLEKPLPNIETTSPEVQPLLDVPFWTEDAATSALGTRHGFLFGRLGLLSEPNLAFELSEVLPDFALPNTRAWFQGLVNVRGNVIPVFDLKQALDDHEPTSAKTMLLIVGSADNSAGLIVDGLPVNIEFWDDDKLADLSSLPDLLRDHTQAAYNYQGRIWLEVNYDSLFHGLSERVMV